MVLPSRARLSHPAGELRGDDLTHTAQATLQDYDKLAKPWLVDQNPGWLGYIGDYTTQLYRDYNKPCLGSL